MNTPPNVSNLNPVLTAAREGGYAVASLSPRATSMIGVVLQTAQSLRSPVILQISQRELGRHAITMPQYADAFYAAIRDHNITLPAVLHLDHTKTLDDIKIAIDAGFTSVMIDASEKPLDENIATTKTVVDYAHPFGVSVEAELGRISTTDFVETDDDTELYTVPEEAQQFVDQTGCDALAVSIGSAHGVYTVRQPTIDYARLSAIRALTDVHLVLHGGSGIPPAMIEAATKITGGGISKVNIATDLEVATLNALAREAHLTNAEIDALPADQREKVAQAIAAAVADKIQNFVKSANRA